MKFYSLNEMKKGWFLGKFTPAAFQNDLCEIAIKPIRNGRTICFFCEEENVYFFVLLKGKCQVNGKKIALGDVIVGNPDEIIAIEGIEACRILQICLMTQSDDDTSYCLDKILMKCNRIRGVKEQMLHEIIPSEEISVVVQGAIDHRNTPICLQSIRRFLPNATIILSTWEGEETNDLDYDILMQSEDPGASYNQILTPFDTNFLNNVNRQLISTQRGLQFVRTKYALKLRTDMIVTSNNFLSYFDLFPKRTDEFRIFDHKVIVNNQVSKLENVTYVDGKEKRFPTPFHPSDWFFFGLTSDLKKYFMHTSPMEQGKMGGYRNYANPEKKEVYQCVWNMQYTPEQFFAVSALRENGYDIPMQDWTDWTDKYVEQSKWFMMNNFIILDFKQHGLYLPKYKNRIMSGSKGESSWENGMWTHSKYEECYEACFGK